MSSLKPFFKSRPRRAEKCFDSYPMRVWIINPFAELRNEPGAAGVLRVPLCQVLAGQGHEVTW